MIKAGVIGGGFIGPVHIEAVRRLGFAVVKTLAASSRESAAKKAKSLSIPCIAENWKEIVDDPEIEVIHICAPNDLHFPIAKAALIAGKHVICEKPLAMNSRESAELLKIAKEKGLVNAVAFNYRFYPMIWEARERIKRGDLGRIFIIHGSYIQDWLLYDTDYNWRLEKEKGGELRAVGDIGSHWCDLIQFVSGLSIDEVLADLATFIPVRKKPRKKAETFKDAAEGNDDYEPMKIETEDYAAVLLRFKEGARGNFCLSQVSAGRKNRLTFEIDGEKSALFWNQENPEKLWIGKRDEPNLQFMRNPALLTKPAGLRTHIPAGHPEGYLDGFKNLVFAIYDFIRKGKNPLESRPDFPTFEDGHRQTLIGEAILKSHREKGWTKV